MHNEIIKKLSRLARRDDLDLWFEDECHFQQHGWRCTMWVPPEDVGPVVLHAPIRKNVGVSGAVCATDGRLTTGRTEKFSADTFFFLQQLVRRRRKGRKMVVVLDNALWHRAKLLQPWLKKHRKYLRLDFLPPYSLELNAIERL